MYCPNVIVSLRIQASFPREAWLLPASRRVVSMEHRNEGLPMRLAKANETWMSVGGEDARGRGRSTTHTRDAGTGAVRAPVCWERRESDGQRRQPELPPLPLPCTELAWPWLTLGRRTLPPPFRCVFPILGVRADSSMEQHEPGVRSRSGSRCRAINLEPRIPLRQTLPHFPPLISSCLCGRRKRKQRVLRRRTNRPYPQSDNRTWFIGNGRSFNNRRYP